MGNSESDASSDTTDSQEKGNSESDASSDTTDSQEKGNSESDASSDTTKSQEKGNSESDASSDTTESQETGNSESDTTESQESPINDFSIIGMIDMIDTMANMHAWRIIFAVIKGDVHEVDNFLSNYRITPRCAYSLLHTAVTSNQLDIIKVFVKHRYELNVPPGENQPLLFTLTEDPTIRRYLMQNSADIPQEKSQDGADVPQENMRLA